MNKSYNQSYTITALEVHVPTTTVKKICRQNATASNFSKTKASHPTTLSQAHLISSTSHICKNLPILLYLLFLFFSPLLSSTEEETDYSLLASSSVVVHGQRSGPAAPHNSAITLVTKWSGIAMQIQMNNIHQQKKDIRFLTLVRVVLGPGLM